MKLPKIRVGLFASLEIYKGTLVLFVLLSYFPQALAQTREWTEKEALVKAAMLLNFSRFTYYPDSDETMSICILGNNPFGEALNSIKDKTVGNKSVEVMIFPEVDDSISQCNLLFISDGMKGQLPIIFEQLQNAPVLTVAEIDGFTSAGGMINLINLGSTTRFQIHREHAESKGLRLSSRVLAIASLVGD